MKTKLITFGVFLLIFVYAFGMTKMYRNVKEDRDRVSDNFFKVKQDIDSLQTDNGDLQYTVESLELKGKELKKYNSDLVQRVEDMGIKIKHLQSIDNIKYKYIYKTDTVPIEKITDTTFMASINNDWIKLEQRITLIESNSYIRIDSLSLEVEDDLAIGKEIKYKGWWFWKKAIGIKLHISSKNPYLNIDRMESINLKNN